MRRAGLCYFFNLLYCKSIYRLALAQKKGGLSYSWLIMICLNSSMKFIKGISHRSLVDNHQISKLQLLICQIMIFDKFDNLFCQVWQLVNAMWSIHFCFSKNWILHFHGYGLPFPDRFITNTFSENPPQFNDRHEKTWSLLLQIGSRMIFSLILTFSAGQEMFKAMARPKVMQI